MIIDLIIYLRIRFKKCIEEICMETIKEQFSKDNSKIEESGKVLERPSETLVTEPPSNKEIGTNENGVIFLNE